MINNMKRIIFNIALLLLFLTVLDYPYTSNIWHEVLGFFFITLVIVHNQTNGGWYKNLFRGKMSALRFINISVNILLLISALTAFITGMMISHLLFNQLMGIRSVFAHIIFIHELHVFSAYALLILTGLHLGLHWQGICSRVSSILKISSSRALHIIGRIAAALLILSGVYFSFVYQIGSRLMMEHVFGGFGSEPDWLLFVAAHLSILSCYAAGAYTVQQFLSKPKRETVHKTVKSMP